MRLLHLPTRAAKDATELQWVKMTPIEWIDDLNAKAMASEGLHPDEESLTSGGGLAAMTLSARPHFAASGGNHCIQGSTKAWGPFCSPMASESIIESPSQNVESLLSKVDPTAMPVFWDFGSLPPSSAIDRIRLLVLAIEDQPRFMEMKPALNQIRDHFTFSQSRAKLGGEFEMLCVETTERLTSLLLLIDRNLRVDASPPITPLSTQSTPTINNVHRGIKPRSTPSSANKAAFQARMTTWLVANWINPYPDEAVTHQLAYETGETPHVVNTWLVNARSRRWRPAVLKAFDLKRPSDYLWEDSINLFEDKPLRPIDEDEDMEEGNTNNKRPRVD